MKSIRTYCFGLFLLGGFIGLLSRLHAQETTPSIDTQPVNPMDGTALSLTPADVASLSALSEAQLAAVVGVLNATPTLPVTALPDNGAGGTYWSLQNPEWAPLPADLGGSAVWPMSQGSYLLNDLNYDYQAAARAIAKSSRRMSLTRPGGTFAPDVFPPPDYGTNLWLAQVSVADGRLNGIGTNTVADVPYEIQSSTDLAQTNWQSEGFILGSETANWTPLSVASGSRTNLFLRLKSWADDGSGLPVWWQWQYFGTTGVDPYGNPAGDGWSNLQKFQNGWNPNVFYTPPAPSGVNTTFNTSNGQFVLSWLPSPGPVTNYLVTQFDAVTGLTTTYNLSPNVYNLTEDLSGDQTLEEENFIADYGPSIALSATVTAQYAGGNSTVAKVKFGVQSSLAVTPLRGVGGSLNLVVTGLPEDTTGIRVYRARSALSLTGSNPLADGYFEISATGITNGIFPVPDDQASQFVYYHFWVQGERANGTNTDWTTDQAGDWVTYRSPFLDARQQLKDNLRFLLRAANEQNPFQFQQRVNPAYNQNNYFRWPTNYVYSSLFASGLIVANGSPYNSLNFDESRPIWENFEWRNFAYDSGYIGSDGFLTDGVFYDYVGGQRQLNISTNPANFYDPTTLLDNATVPNSLLGQRETRWIVPMPDTINYPTNDGARNLYGLPYLSVNSATSGGSTVYSPVTTVTNGFPYFETAQPGFQAAGYLFARPLVDASPELSGFGTTNTTPMMIQGVGTKQQYAGYAKLAVTNGYSGVYAYLGQYLDQAYQIDTNGNVTVNPAGVLSPYGDFFPTQPGPVALLTMPDIDPPYERGTCTVYAVSLVLDKNHDGFMDQSFNGPDATSQSSPYIFWANNNYDRLTLDADDQIEYDDDVQIGGDYFTQNTPVPDHNFKDGAGHRAIPCARDLQDFFRLWVCGIDTNLIAKLPAGSTITLNWGDVGSPNTGNPTIDIFAAADPDGGIGYLTNSLTAEIQTDPVICPYIGRLGPGQSIQLNAIQFANGWAGNHFIMCGVSNGTGGLNLTIADASGNVLAQSTSYLQIVDIKQMYERWTIGDMPSIALKTNAVPATEDLPIGASAFQYTQPQDTNTPYILFVHGWNMERWEKDRFAESAFKRLYWQGYHGRFGEFRWPTENGFTGKWYQFPLNPSIKDNFDRSEYTAWQSSVGLLNKLKDLNTEYPGHVYMLAHSMGNIVAGEALRLATQQGLGHLVNTYVASQAAVSAHTYDTNIANYSFNYPFVVSQATTPNIYGNWFLGNNGGGAGQIINFFNTNDFALQRSVWQLDQLLKPDQFVLLGGTHWDYSYVGVTNDPPPWNHFQKDASLQIWNEVNFDIVNVLTNRYEVMGLAAQPWTTAFGATPGVQNVSQDVDLTQFWPPDLAHPTHPFDEHFYHSAEFRGDYWQQQGYWNELLGPEVFNLK